MPEDNSSNSNDQGSNPQSAEVSHTSSLPANDPGPIEIDLVLKIEYCDPMTGRDIHLEDVDDDEDE